MYFLYILYSDTLGRYYIGISKDPQARLHSHNTSPKGWTRRGRPWELLYTRNFQERSIAEKYERWLKRQKSQRLIKDILNDQFDWQKLESKLAGRSKKRLSK